MIIFSWSISTLLTAHACHKCHTFKRERAFFISNPIMPSYFLEPLAIYLLVRPNHTRFFSKCENGQKHVSSRTVRSKNELECNIIIFFLFIYFYDDWWWWWCHRCWIENLDLCRNGMRVIATAGLILLLSLYAEQWESRAI